jgi:2-hydroxycyclohexanecarboxyl-CoA dehydrogenase
MERSTVNLENKTAFVTGGSSGIGRAIVELLSEQGARVAVADVDEAGGKAAVEALEPGRATFVKLDLTDGSTVPTAVQSAESELGPIDILVNCAGADVIKPFLETDEDLWEWLVQLNLFGVLRTTKAVLPGMIERGSGRIVNVSSDAARVGSSGEAVYSACKGGVISFTKSVARESARAGVTVNAVCPGPTDTPATQKTLAEGGEKIIKALTRAIPLGRLALPEDIAGAVLFFASDHASFVTGQTISVSGGLSMV